MAIISSAPILSKLKTSGGTFYTLSSTVNDFSYLFSDSTVRIAPSKFVAMKLPKWQNTTTQRMYRDPNDVGQPSITDPNDVLPKILQDYTENLIQYSESTRTDNTLMNYAESAWWKTLRMLGAMNLVSDGTTVIENGVTKNVYKEEAASATYDPIIKFVGDVNLLNHVKSNGNEYIEMFVNIPTSQGKMETIKFKKGDITHPSGLIPNGGGTDYTSGLQTQYTANQHNAKAIYDNTTTKQYQVGTDVDDACVYFDDILGDTTRHKKGDFEFNAIALYYDIYDKNDATKKRTNLYGILFVEDFNNITAGVGELPLLKKYQPSANSAGNGFSFRMNLKFSNASNQVTSEVSVNDYSTVSMELYMDALRRLTIMTDKVETALEVANKVKTENDRLITTIMKQDEVLSAINQINTNKSDIQLIKSGDVLGSSSNVRISNEELFLAFDRVLKQLATTNTNITLQNIISHKSYLGKLIDTTNNIIEYADGTKYQWNTTTQTWVQI